MNRWSSNTSEIYRLQHLRCQNNIRIFMTVRHICSWQHQSTSENMMSIKEPPYGVCFLCGKGQLETVLASTADIMLSKLDKQDTKERNFVNSKQKSPSKFLFHRNICQIFQPCKSRMDAPKLQRNLEWLPRQPDVPAISIVLKVVCPALLIYSINIISFLGL